MIFEQTRFEPAQICSKALEEADIWRTTISENPNPVPRRIDHNLWRKPPLSMTKCNIGVSWIHPYRNCGVSWILRDSQGTTLFHGRRSFSCIPSLEEAELMGILWAAESLRNMRQTNIIFESSLAAARAILLEPQKFMFLREVTNQIFDHLAVIDVWSLDYVSREGNQAAEAIALSVTKEHRYSSYISQHSPQWLLPYLP